MFKKLVFVLFLAIPVFAFSQNTPIKLGFLDAQDLFLSLPEAAKIEASLKELGEKHEKQMRSMENEFNSKYADYQEKEKAGLMTPAIRETLESELQMLQTRMQNYYKKAQDELQKAQEDLQNPLKEKILKAIKDVGTENGFLYIFESSNLLFKSDQAIDVTPLVKRKLGVTK